MDGEESLLSKEYQGKQSAARSQRLVSEVATFAQYAEIVTL